MPRKIIALLLGLSMIMSMSTAAFSLYQEPNIVTNAQLEASFEISDLQKEVYVRDNLLISISLNEDFVNYQVPVEMTLYALDDFVELERSLDNSSSLEGDSNDMVLSKNIEFKDSVEVDISALSNDEISKAYSELSLYKSYLNKNLKAARAEIIDLNNLEISTVKKDQDKITEETQNLLKEAPAVKEVIVESSEESSKTSAELKEKSEALVSIYEKLLSEIDLVNNELNRIEDIYNSSFERQVGEAISLKKRFVPLTKTYENIGSGRYKLEFVRKDNNVVIKSLEFTVIKNKELTEEKIKENIINNIINPLDILYKK